MKMDEDQLLIKEILKGKTSSFEALMRKYNKKIFGFVLRMVRDEELSKEITQEFFLKIYSSIEKYNFNYKFTTWAYKICYNLVIDNIRKNKAKVESIHTEVQDFTSFKSDNYVHEDGFKFVSDNETRDYIWQIINELPIKYREVILMRYLKEMSYDEIAEVTDLPLGTVKNRLFKARELLKERIKNEGMLDR